MGGVGSMEWKEVRLGDVCDLQEGYVNPAQTHPEYFDGPIKWVRAVDLNNANIYSTTRTLTETGFRSAGKSALLFEPNTIVISKSGTIGRLGIVKDYMCGNRAIINIKPHKPEDLHFIFYLLRNAQKDFENYAVGSVQKNLYVPILADIKFKVPSDLSTQRRISSILSSLDRKIELNNKINATLEELAQTLFKSWFVDFEPFKNGNFIETEIGKIPEGWRVGSVYEYVKVIYGAPYKSKLFNDKGEGLPLIRIRDLKGCSPQFFTEEILPNTEYIERGDIVAGMDAEFSPHIWKGEKGLLNQRVCKLKPAVEGVSNLFALYLLKPHLEFTQSYKTGTTVSHLGKGDIDRFVAVLPPKEVVLDISNKLDAILQRICSLSQENLILTHLRDTLLPRLMSGEITIA